MAGNLGFNRLSCLSSYVSHLVSVQRYFRFYNDDESSFAWGIGLMPDPKIGGLNWTNATTSGSTITFHVAGGVNGINTPSPFNQSTGNGDAVRVTGATTSCLNGWFLISSTSGGWSAPTSCPSGQTYNATTDPNAKLVFLYSPANCQGQIGCENMSPFPGNPGTGTLVAGWGFITSINCTATPTCTVNWSGNNIPNGRAIRIRHATTANLNIIAPITVVNANSFTITYPNTTGGMAPAAGTYNSTSDPNLAITLDPGWPANPLGTIISTVRAVPNAPTINFSMLGANFSTLNHAGVYSYQGNPNNVGGAFDYIPGPPPALYGPDTSVNAWAYYSDGTSGLTARAYQLKPRSMLWAVGLYSQGFCRSFHTFNPGCDRPYQLYNRPETLVAQIMGMVTLNIIGLRGYNFYGNMSDLYTVACCGWQSTGTGAGRGMNPFVGPKQWSAMAHTNALLHLREDTHLQPEANKPYFGPYFKTDAHTSAIYGNELMILCASEMPYGQFAVTLPRISGGSMLKYTLTGYSLRVSLLSGNPATDTAEFCAAPGQTTTYVAQPAGVNALDNITFSRPAALPFGASKMLLQVGYYPRAMQDDPVTDCTSTCTIPVDHHNTDAWYRIIYADSNNLPLSIGEPVKIPSQGLN